MREMRVASIQPEDQFRVYSSTGPEPERVDELREQNMDLACRLLARAGEMGADIACYPEDVQGIGHYMFRADTALFLDLVEEIPGPTTERIGAVASKHRMHIVYTQYERVGDTIYNAAVVLGREGGILGKYYKIQMPAVERWTVTRGDAYPVFQTDFGVVGVLTCYDFVFPEVTRGLVLSGAEMLFCPTMGISMRGMCEGNGVIRVQARAMDNFVPIAVSTCRKDSMIVNSDGTLLAMARPGVEEVIIATIDLDATPVDHSEWEMITGTDDVKARIMQERLPQAYLPLTDPHPPVLDRYEGKRLRPAPEPRAPLFEERERWWARHGGGE
jgi:predicted amidohydrolase